MSRENWFAFWAPPWSMRRATAHTIKYANLATYPDIVSIRTVGIGVSAETENP